MHSRAERRYGQKLKFDFSFSAQAYSVVGPISKQVLFYKILIGAILGGGKSHFMFMHSLMHYTMGPMAAYYTGTCFPLRS